MEKKLNYSRKREAILQAVKSTTCHPNAEWVYQKLKPDYPNLSLGTVYRNLALFKTEGEIIGVGVVNGQERFDGNVKPHTHFVCSECGAVLDVPGDFLDRDAIAAAAEAAGVQVNSFSLTIDGICPKCMKRRKPLQ